jgi:hypothetical protein
MAASRRAAAPNVTNAPRPAAVQLKPSGLFVPVVDRHGHRRKRQAQEETPQPEVPPDHRAAPFFDLHPTFGTSGNGSVIACTPAHTGR